MKKEMKKEMKKDAIGKYLSTVILPAAFVILTITGCNLATGVQSTSCEKSAADKAAELIDAIYVQERTADTDRQCIEARAAWDALTDEQKEQVKGVNADPDYFGLDTGDASKDSPGNEDGISANEILVVSFGTSYNESRVMDINGIEAAIGEAFPDWSVRRAFTSQIIINHIQSRDNELIDNVEQALDRAVENKVENLVVLPTHLMHGAEYDEMKETIDAYAGKFESVKIAEPLLGEVGQSIDDINEDKELVSRAVVSEALMDSGYKSAEEAAADAAAYVLLGHGTSHTAKVSYSQMITQMKKLGYSNVFIGTVEGEPEETECSNVINEVKAAGYKKVILRPLMVVAGDHANNDMAGSEDDSWKSMFEASGNFETVETQLEGLGRVEDIKKIYISHVREVIEE